MANPSGAGPAPFFPRARYDASVTPPEACLGFPVGERMATPEKIIGCFRQWASESPRVKVERAALSHEGRELIRVIIATPEHHRRMSQLREDLSSLADPRGVAQHHLQRVVDESPAIAWLGYSIHGDETSGADASLVVGYLLAAATHPEVGALLSNCIVVIDPVMNPDGRSRIIRQVRQSDGVVPSLNYSGFHRGYWPWGRGNHYLFDMNRDWIVGSQPETRGRWEGLLKYRPQLMVDAHEMGPNDTYLFYPRAEPVNPNLSVELRRWTKIFAEEQGAAFDAYGWPYYTREWADGWYPGYSDAWGSLLGAIGILYEQAKVWGRPLRTQSGQMVTYRETVHHQAVSSWTNLQTLSNNRHKILHDYLGSHKRSARGPARTLAVSSSMYPDRVAHLVTTLLRQGIEVWRSNEAFELRPEEAEQSGVVSRSHPSRMRFPRGSYLVDAHQPRGATVRALLDFDPKFSAKVLKEERTKLEQENESGIYDVTAWNLAMSYGLPAAWLGETKVSRTPVVKAPELPSGMAEANRASAVAWVVSGAYDSSIAFAAAALEKGIRLRVATRAFAAGEEIFPRGSLLVRRIDNLDQVEEALDKLGRSRGVPVVPVFTARSPDDGPDLGGQSFRILHRPRIGLLTQVPALPADYGHLWHHIDQELRMPATLLNIGQLGDIDLRRYNVLVVPPVGGGGDLKAHAERLRTWVRSGGTLIAMGESAALVAKAPFGISKVQLRRDVVEDVSKYQQLANRWFQAQRVEVDSAAVWQGDAGSASEKSRLEERSARSKEVDKWARRFAPQGAFLRAHTDSAQWLGMGMPAELPVLVRGPYVLMAPEDVSVPVRLGRPKGLRLSGLLWPEARERLASTAWATVERVGSGQVILFSMSPVFRALQRGTARLLSNGLVFGPSLGAVQPAKW